MLKITQGMLNFLRTFGSPPKSGQIRPKTEIDTSKMEISLPHIGIRVQVAYNYIYCTYIHLPMSKKKHEERYRKDAEHKITPTRVLSVCGVAIPL